MQPTWGGWGGRFNSRKTKNPINLNGGGYGEDYYIYTKAHDTSVICSRPFRLI
jgi:hypothetical protein